MTNTAKLNYKVSEFTLSRSSLSGPVFGKQVQQLRQAFSWSLHCSRPFAVAWIAWFFWLHNRCKVEHRTKGEPETYGFMTLGVVLSSLMLVTLVSFTSGSTETKSQLRYPSFTGWVLVPSPYRTVIGSSYPAVTSGLPVITTWLCMSAFSIASRSTVVLICFTIWAAAQI